uniref:Protein PRRC1-like isoform X2 n=1 Tax=Hirondellea gigas TaxID=1518452 RepID=A0A6A7FTG4_9CRUS
MVPSAQPAATLQTTSTVVPTPAPLLTSPPITSSIVASSNSQPAASPSVVPVVLPRSPATAAVASKPVTHTAVPDTKPMPVKPVSAAAPPPVTSQPKHPGLGLTTDGNSLTAGEEEGGGDSSGWVGWIRGTVSTVGMRMAQKAKTSMDTMITTLDPQMKEFLHSGGDLDLVVASDKEVKVSPVREAFQHVFGKATVSGQAPAASSEVAQQPVGIENCLAAAEKRINSIRSSNSLPHPSLPVLAVENCIAQLTPDCWYDIGVLLLDDPYHDIIMQITTQSTPIPEEWVAEARARTPADYHASSSGLAVTIGQVAASKLLVHHGLWHEAWCGVSRREMLHTAARSLATLYRAKLPHQ